MDLQIVDLRKELPPFYQKLGYKEKPGPTFPADIIALASPCHFIRMSKGLCC